MYQKLALIVLLSLFIIGCASVPMESEERSNDAKEFRLPADGYSGLYIFRVGGPGAALKKDIWVNGKCIGESAPNVFFYEQVESGKEYIVSTESEFSPNDLLVSVESGNNYYIQQYIKMGVFVGGAGLELVSEEEGKKKISELELGKMGICSY